MLVRFLIEEFIAEKRYENVTEHSIKTSEYNYKHLEGFLAVQDIEQVKDSITLVPVSLHQLF